MSMTTGTCPGDDPVAATPRPAKDPTTQTFRLVNVTFPPDSQCRRAISGSAEAPILFVCVLRDGNSLGKCSTYSARGWSVDFPDGEHSRWEIEQGTNAKYGLQLLAHGVLYNATFLSIDDIQGDEFRQVITEPQAKGVGKGCLTTFTFEAVPDSPLPATAPTKKPLNVKEGAAK